MESGNWFRVEDFNKLFVITFEYPSPLLPPDLNFPPELVALSNVP